MSTMFKKDRDLNWTEMATFSYNMDVSRIVMGLQNFVATEYLTPATSSMSAVVDNFKINAAENIIEGGT